MKKRIWLSVVCISMTGLVANAQTKAAPPPPPAPVDLVAPPPPPPPPAEMVAPPPPPPPPPPPSELAATDLQDFQTEEPALPETLSTVIINNNGYEISIHKMNGRDMVVLKKDNQTQMIRLSTWNSRRKYYEKKYGQLPPPPPPPPAPAILSETEI